MNDPYFTEEFTEKGEKPTFIKFAMWWTSFIGLLIIFAVFARITTFLHEETGYSYTTIIITTIFVIFSFICALVTICQDKGGITE